MVNHPNRNWRRRWTVDLESAAATHVDGWVFQFVPVPGETGVFDGKCIQQPTPLTKEHIRSAARIAKEAGEVYVEARQKRH